MKEKTKQHFLHLIFFADCTSTSLSIISPLNISKQAFLRGILWQCGQQILLPFLYPHIFVVKPNFSKELPVLAFVTLCNRETLFHSLCLECVR